MSSFSNAWNKFTGAIPQMNTMSETQRYIMYTFIALYIIVIIFILIYVFINSTKNNNNCKNMNKLYKAFPFIRNISPSNEDFSYNLRDYYIKTAYNCCSAGDFKNDFVNVCALKNCIKQGVRCLDFEIYSVNNVPVISTSSKNKFDFKETYNTVAFADAISIVANYAFSSSTCPNPNDPLIIHLRIMSNNKPIYDLMANTLHSTLARRLLGKSFSYDNHGNNLGKIPLKDLIGKVVIITDKTDTLLKDSLLNEYVNLCGNTPFLHELRFSEVLNTSNMNDLIEFNKQNMSIVLPDVSKSNRNPPPSAPIDYGSQLVALSFQNFDSSLEAYNEMFDSAGTAFVLKPEGLRYVPVTIPVPPPPNPAYSYKQRDIKADYYNFTI